MVPPILNYITDKQWYIDLSFNNLSTVPDGTFGNLSISGVFLDHNQITVIGDDVFRGSEDKLFSLYLHFNRLTELPGSVGKLKSLNEIQIHGNPITTFDKDILRNISSSLNQISYGSSALRRWPYEMTLLSKTDWITLYGIEMDSLPDNAFDELFILNITGTKLRSLSNTLSNQEKFYEFDLQDNPLLTAAGLAKGGFKNLPKLRTLSIINCGIETLPPIFDQMTDLGEIILDRNPITDIGDLTFPRNYTSIWQVTIKNSLLHRIPASFSHLTKVMNIFLMNNKITTINEDDFLGMGEMYNLYLSGNPITNISDNAFGSLKQLGFLYLDGTPLTTIPKAIRNLPNLGTLNMKNSPVECICSRLRWMKDWLPSRKRSISFIGICSNQGTRTIQDFVTRSIPYCI